MEAAHLDERISRLGQELKNWERRFATSHNGSKPTRQDIKQDATIASKYSEYHRLRGSRSSKPRNVPASPQASKKRKASFRDLNPGKCLSKSATMPSKDRQLRTSEDRSPEHINNENLLPAQDACVFVGPTPQKDGRVLGLFDVLPESTTPSKASNPQLHESQSPLCTINVNAIAATPTRSNLSPTRQKTGLGEDLAQTTSKNVRTPVSSGKRFLLDSYVTPSKRRRINEANTPQSLSEHAHSATPAFLQRSRLQMSFVSGDGSTLNTIAEYEPSNRAPMRPVGTKRKSLARSFSSMIANIRQAEDDRLDEELDMLRELEGETAEHGQAENPRSSKSNVLVGDSQAASILGPDGAGPLSEDEEDPKQSLGRDGKPLRIWKKKGQKRQTRRVNMRPTVKAKVSKSATHCSAEDSADENKEENGENRCHDERDTNDTENQRDHDSNAYDNTGSESNSEDDLRDSQQLLKMRKTRNEDGAAAPNQATINAVEAEEQPKKAENMVHKVVKKVSATAHANFRRLKIRSSKGAKAAGRGKVGRGRR